MPWSYSVVVSTPDFESGIVGSNPSKTYQYKKIINNNFIIFNQ